MKTSYENQTTNRVYLLNTYMHYNIVLVTLKI